MLNKIIQWSIKNRLVVVIAAMGLLIYGGIVAFRAPVDVFPDLTAPTVNITGPVAGNVSGTINVTADATDNVGVAGYQIWRGGVVVATATGTTWSEGLAASGTYTYSVTAYDSAGNNSSAWSIKRPRLPEVENLPP